jgi:CRISPR system Cascade subunit CasB
MTLTEPDEASGGWRQPRRLGELGTALDKQLKKLQKRYLNDDPAARADLARLRRGLGKPPGDVPEIWSLTTRWLPESLFGDDDQPSRAEHAAHIAMTLYARHQQSLPIPAHDGRMPFARAVARLARRDRDRESAVTKRFMAVATADSFDELITHVRGLVSQLRADRRGMDYARFADDVVGLLTPGRQTAVRLAWGRQFYRTEGVEPDEPEPDDDADHDDPSDQD